MADHAAPTVSFPAQRVIRTVIQTTAAVLLGLVTFITTLALLAPQFLDALEDILPPHVYAWLAGAVVFIAALSGAIARIMAIPGVNDFLVKLRAGSVPKVTVYPPTSIPRSQAQREAETDAILRGEDPTHL